VLSKKNSNGIFDQKFRARQRMGNISWAAYH
jgi:hypothetical protein